MFAGRSCLFSSNGAIRAPCLLSNSRFSLLFACASISRGGSWKSLQNFHCRINRVHIEFHPKCVCIQQQQEKQPLHFPASGPHWFWESAQPLADEKIILNLYLEEIYAIYACDCEIQLRTCITHFCVSVEEWERWSVQKGTRCKRTNDPSHFLQSRNEANTFSLECALGA